MTADTRGAAQPPSTLADALWRDRARLAAFGGIVAAVNGVGTIILDTIGRVGTWDAIFSLAGVSAGIWFALFAVFAIAREDAAPELATPADRAIWVAMLGASVVPVVLAGSVAVCAGGLWFAVRGVAGGRARRIGIVLLALSSTLLWGRIVLMGFGDALLALDGRFVAALAGTVADGNMVRFADARGSFVIGAPCSSMHNMTFAILLWASVTQLMALRVTMPVVLVCVAAMTANLLVNGVRLALIALYPQYFDTLHNGAGALVFGWVGLVVAGLVVGLGLYAATRPRL